MYKEQNQITKFLALIIVATCNDIIKKASVNHDH